MDNSQITIKPGTEVDSTDLALYYKEKYGKRYDFLKNNWKWHYNLKLINNKFPRILDYDGKIIGYASGIPFLAEMNGKIFKAAWFVDLMIEPAYRRMGIATTASEDYFSFGEIHFGHPNEKSIKLLKKMGWGQNPDSFLHFLFINPLNHHRYKDKIPKLIQGIINYAFRTFITPVYKVNSFSLDSITMEAINKENLKDFENSQKRGPNIISTYRNWDYLQWRILSSPDVSLYRIVTHKDTGHKFIIKLIKDSTTNHVEVLMIKEPIEDSSFIKLMATICFWATRHEFDYVLSYTTLRSRSKKLKGKLLSYRLFKNYIFFSQNEKLQKMLDNSVPYWDLIDDDLEKF